MIDEMTWEWAVIALVAHAAIMTARSAEDLRIIRRTYTGKNGLFTRAMKINGMRLKSC